MPDSGDSGSGMERLFTLKLMQATKHRMRVLTAFPDATLHLLHVAASGNDEEARQHMRAFATRHQLTHYQTASVQADGVSAGVEQYAQQVQADLVVLPTYHHSGLSSFLHAGITDTVAAHALPPVLTYHFA